MTSTPQRGRRVTGRPVRPVLIAGARQRALRAFRSAQEAGYSEALLVRVDPAGGPRDIMDRRIELAGGAGPHDGTVVDGAIYFTSGDGTVAVADGGTGRVARRIDLRGRGRGPKRWYRGIHVDGDIAWVGFSRLRRTRFRENLRRLRDRGGQPTYSTNVACYEFASGRQLAEDRLDDLGMDVVFYILPAAADGR